MRRSVQVTGANLMPRVQPICVYPNGTLLCAPRKYLPPPSSPNAPESLANIFTATLLLIQNGPALSLQGNVDIDEVTMCLDQNSDAFLWPFHKTYAPLMSFPSPHIVFPVQCCWDLLGQENAITLGPA